MTATLIRKSNATIDVGDDASFVVIGVDDVISLGASSSLTATGSNLHVTAQGAGDVVTIGGNGLNANDAQDNFVTFLAPGTLNVLANSRVAAYASGARIVIAGTANLGVLGAGDIVIDHGVGGGVWIGGNGQFATGNSIDVVHGVSGGTLYEYQSSNVVVDGGYFTATLAGFDALSATGKGIQVEAEYGADIVNIGGNGRAAADADLDTVQFSGPGTLNVFANSRVVGYGDGVAANLAGRDNLGLYGFGNVVTTYGVNDGVWIGGDGDGAYPPDAVHGLTSGTLFEMQNSYVSVDGSHYTATMGGAATLNASGDVFDVQASGAGNVLNVSTTPFTTSHATVHMTGGGVVNTTSAYKVSVYGDRVTVNAAGLTALELFGADDAAVSTDMVLSSCVIGQNGAANQTLDALSFAGGFKPALISVLAGSNVEITGANARVTLGGGDRLTLTGNQETVSDVAGNNAIAIGGNGSLTFSNTVNVVTLSEGDTVTMLNNSNATLLNSGSVTNGEHAVHMGADDSLFVAAGETIYVPLAAGADTIAGLDDTDVLNLAAHFASVDDLLAHTRAGNLGYAVVQLDPGADTLTLTMSTAAFAAYAQAGLVKFA